MLARLDDKTVFAAGSQGQCASGYGSSWIVRSGEVVSFVCSITKKGAVVGGVKVLGYRLEPESKVKVRGCVL